MYIPLGLSMSPRYVNGYGVYEGMFLCHCCSSEPTESAAPLGRLLRARLLTHLFVITNQLDRECSNFPHDVHGFTGWSPVRPRVLVRAMYAKRVLLPYPSPLSIHMAIIGSILISLAVFMLSLAKPDEYYQVGILAHSSGVVSSLAYRCSCPKVFSSALDLVSHMSRRSPLSRTTSALPAFAP
jgi:hypothetical protein